MIQIIDYGAGNIRNVCNALTKIGQKYVVIDDGKSLNPNEKVIFPGVGAAGSAMQNLYERGLVSAIKKIKAPFLGICLGMQLLFEYSEENDTDCLGIINGRVRKFGNDLKVPQIGWNKVKIQQNCQLFYGVPDENYFYFVNSYYVDCDEKFSPGLSAYGKIFNAVIARNNFYGVQFHPEKSGEIGLKLLSNFCAIC